MLNVRLMALLCISWLFQPVSRAQQAQSKTAHSAFEKIIYHNGRCFGTCPVIDMEIDSDLTVLLSRDILDEMDKTPSGNFKGKIDLSTYGKLLNILASSNYKALKFPPIFCCDGGLTTIIIYSEGKRTKLSSMFPPRTADKLITFLYHLAMNLNLPPTTDEIKLEQ